MEEMLLGGLLRHRDTVEAALAVLYEEDFRTEANRVLFAAVAALHASGSPVDLVLVAEQLRHQGQVDQAGGYVRLVELWDSACFADEVLSLAHRLHAGYEGV